MASRLTVLVRNSAKFVGRVSPIAPCLPAKLLQRVPVNGRATPVCCGILQHIHTSAPHSDLMEFFDDKENWAESSVKVGRPWKKDELRLKSNSDLHKLWYVLLKERNMLMTMEEEYKRQAELFPNPERFEKVEESMENLLDVVAERNRAYNLLQTGETGEPGVRWALDQLGRGYWRRCQEFYQPLHASGRMRKYNRFNGPWQNRYLQLWREKKLKQYWGFKIRESRRKQALKDTFPDIDIE